MSGDKKDWKSFFDYMEFDTIRDDVFHLAHALQNDGYHIFVCSGRNEKHRDILDTLQSGKLSEEATSTLEKVAAELSAKYKA